MMARVFISRDAGARSVGSDRVADAVTAEARRRGIDLSLVRNGSRGLYWLEPLVEVDVAGIRHAYGPVTPEAVPGLFDAGWLEGGAHPLALGPTAELPYLKNQARLVFARMGITDPLSLDDYRAHGGLAGLDRALSLAPEAIVADVEASGLRGRGGAGFPTGIKWRTVLNAGGGQKYIVCNADEGDSGTFSDRMLMEGDPFCLIEGMVIAGLAVGADTGYIYLRSEYPDAWEVLEAAIATARAAGLLGASVLGSGRAFDLILFKGAGAYVCGEETALLESIEGKRGLVRVKPPLPALEGLFGKPTVVNNVITLASAPWILAHGGKAFAEYGMGRSRGTLPFQLAGNLKRPGLVEAPFGITLAELLNDYGGGSASGRPLRAVQVGGPLGAYVPASQFNLPLDYEAFAAVGATVGHGGIVAFDDTVDMARMARYAMHFCAEESCGKCTPCRIGSTRGVELLDAMVAARPQARNDDTLLRDLCQTMLEGSLCALGGMTPYPVLSALNHYPEDFGLAPKGEETTA
ncbi:MAG TPA: NADH-ubiquinone oxidoreductase-F iron-sulfur binding region domain-containing protein [Thiobacillaceae bacterium]|nr:NADH-ubiquinone oxidoreductase-F iron-sulfur binding region domain-containing protein [Thiobacillaceae bacterium]HNF88884.1 NADH-ubiquinone oxidoreductase-F iron-sulfur binding region domain-containing protein [Thiobacillaceae bacterium]HNH88739.1 NADH-ubiquinone oxidoreductase-F iron-sulfur binding region domain-containing protein [Thiobacillaceae bacterium]HNI07432.1 NADH-ubiquinone oxidoreductase-F iron-sulfur binding region domain-containing protein [Thiobacillaceae bacterium]